MKSLNKSRLLLNLEDTFKIKAQITQLGVELTFSISLLPSQPIVNFAYLKASQLSVRFALITIVPAHTGICTIHMCVSVCVCVSTSERKCLSGVTDWQTDRQTQLN